MQLLYANGLCVNSHKCHFMSFCRGPLAFDALYGIGDSFFERVDSTKDLGSGLIRPCNLRVKIALLSKNPVEYWVS